MIYDATLQVSKKILFLRPYAGAGYSFGKSTVTGGVLSTLTYEKSASGTAGTYTASTYEDLANEITAAGGTPPDFTATGFSYKAESTSPVFRVYGGLSFSLLINLDAQVIYVPETKALGASVAARLQL